MKFSKSLNCAVVTVFLVFISQSHGKVPAGLAASAEIEKIVASQSFQDQQEAMIMSGTDKESLTIQAVMNDIRNEVQKFPVHAVFPLAVNEAIDGILGVLRLTNACVREAHNAINTSRNLVKNQDLDRAFNTIQKGFKAEKEMTFIIGVDVHNSLGHALALSGSSAMPGFAKTIASVQAAGSTALEVLKIGSELTETGMLTGGPAAEESLITAEKVLMTGTKAIYGYLKEAATHALEGLQSVASNETQEVNLVSGIIDSLKTQITTANRAALNAVDGLGNNFKSISSVLTKKMSIDAANLIHEGLRSTIIKIAEAINIVRKALLAAENIAEEEPTVAITAIGNAVKSANVEVYSASSYGCLALGSAGHITGKATTEALIPDLIEIEIGVSSVYQDLALVERIASVGIRGGKLAMKEGIKTALDICEAAGMVLFQDCLEAGQNAFEVLRNL